MHNPTGSAAPSDFSLAFLRIAELGLAALDGKPISGIDGAWRHTWRDVRGWEWDVAVNGHRDAVASPITDGSRIDPFSAHVYVNGWPFAILTPDCGGVMGNGEGANEDLFIAACEQEARSLALKARKA